eukprot:TRINITY_DN990_c0_g2_i1.p1 TRINITY_DN990_c0_g2~~TRINITY_DN990_c0_g2_i1.p1  ORF type:complete len:213 (+),score=28.78 TRINITY_DN990_c0_g2_i1:300-938(+)
MPSAHEWSTYIKGFSCVILVWGAVDIILAFTQFYGFSWESFTVGALYVTTGCVGIKASVNHRTYSALRYLRVLILTTVVVIVIGIINACFITPTTNAICSYQNLDEYDCQSLKTTALAICIVSLASAFTFCLGCIWCAHAYYRELEHEEHHLPQFVSVVAPGYQVVGMPPPAVYPPQVYYGAHSPYQQIPANYQIQPPQMMPQPPMQPKSVE